MKNQWGVGLVEVLVALVLLAIGVLGFTALQLRAVDATGEALTRSQAMLILRGLTESMRVNPDGQSDYPAAVQKYMNLDSRPNGIKGECFDFGNSSFLECTSTEMAHADAYVAVKEAARNGIRMTMTDCPGIGATIKRQCIFAAWGDTASKLKANDYSACMGSDGIYKFTAQCLMMEAY